MDGDDDYDDDGDDDDDERTDPKNIICQQDNVCNTVYDNKCETVYDTVQVRTSTYSYKYLKPQTFMASYARCITMHTMFSKHCGRRRNASRSMTQSARRSMRRNMKR